MHTSTHTTYIQTQTTANVHQHFLLNRAHMAFQLISRIQEQSYFQHCFLYKRRKACEAS